MNHKSPQSQPEHNTSDKENTVEPPNSDTVLSGLVQFQQRSFWSHCHKIWTKFALQTGPNCEVFKLCLMEDPQFRHVQTTDYV
jgi:hypothetical protein